MAIDELTRKQQLFAVSYATDFNATRAAIEAGYSEHAAAQEGSRLLRNVKVEQAVVAELEARMAPIDAKADDILQLDLEIAFADIGQLASWDSDGVKVIPSKDLDPAIRRAVASVEHGKNGVRIRLHPKHPSLERLTKRFELAERSEAGNRIETTETKAAAAQAWLREAALRWDVTTIDELIEALQAELEPAASNRGA